MLISALLMALNAQPASTAYCTHQEAGWCVTDTVSITPSDIVSGDLMLLTGQLSAEPSTRLRIAVTPQCSSNFALSQSGYSVQSLTMEDGSNERGYRISDGRGCMMRVLMFTNSSVPSQALDMLEGALRFCQDEYCTGFSLAELVAQ